MYKKVIAILITVAFSMMLPLSAFAAGSVSTVTQDAGAGISVQCPDKYTITAQTLTADDEPALAAQVGTLTATQTVLYFEVDAVLDDSAAHDIDGTVTITFPVDSAYNGTYVTIYHQHADGTITSEKKVVSNGGVSISTSDLSPFALLLDTASTTVSSDTSTTSITTVSSDTSSTSPQTGADDMMGIALATGAAAIAAGAVAFALRKRVTE
jgi:LPXTG-motif cell wall-anchored protein